METIAIILFATVIVFTVAFLFKVLKWYLRQPNVPTHAETSLIQGAINCAAQGKECVIEFPDGRCIDVKGGIVRFSDGVYELSNRLY
jgi:hypothetical protein